MASEQAPPTYPTDLNEIGDAAALCSKIYNRGDSALSPLERARLIRYCGRMPIGPKQAHRWKIYLRALKREAEAEPDEDP